MTTNAIPQPDNGATRTPHPTPGDPRVPQPDADRPMRARVVFGRETGRLLSDGRIIGRAEPFAKVFASSRHVKRVVARQEQRDRLLAGWTAALSEALTDAQLTAAVERFTRAVGGLDRRSAPVAASQILAGAIATATATNAAADPETFRRRVRHAINDLEAERAPRQPKLEGGSDAPEAPVRTSPHSRPEPSLQVTG